MEHPDPRHCSVGERHQCDEQQEESHQDVDGCGGSLYSGLAPAPALRCPEPDGPSDKHVHMSNKLVEDANHCTAGIRTSTSSGFAVTGWRCPTAPIIPSYTCSAM